MTKVAVEKEEAQEVRAKVRLGRERELDDLRFILSEPAGRRFLSRLLARCGTHQSVWEPSAAIHRNAGIQEVGHYLLSEIVAADSEAGAQLLIEAYQAETKGVR